jgi:hypothetical protein
MAKVTNPLLSEDASGNFGKIFTFKRGAVVTKYFRPKNPKTVAQEAHRIAFRNYYMASLTQAQADLLYAAITHDHDGIYSLIGHEHKQIILIGGQINGATLAPGATGVMALYGTGFIGTGGNSSVPYNGVLKRLYVRVPGTQPGTGTLVFTVMHNSVASSMVATEAAGQGGNTVSDLSHKINVTAGDLLYVQAKNNASTTSAAIGAFNVSLELETTE